MNPEKYSETYPNRMDQHLKSTENDLRIPSQGEFFEAVERITDGFFLVDRYWRILYGNAHAEKIAKRSRKELIGKKLWDEFPQFKSTLFFEKYHEAMNSGETVSFETYIPNVSAWLEVRVYASPSGLSIFLADVTNKKFDETIFRERVDSLIRALEASDIGVWDWNADAGKLHEEGNPYLQWLDSMHPLDRERAKRTVQAYLSGVNAKFEFEYRQRTKDGFYRWILARGISLMDADGNPTRMVGFNVDISDQKRIQEQLRRLSTDLAVSNRELEQFAAVTSHDLKEPLRMISLQLQLLERKYKDIIDEKAKAYIQNSVKSAQQLTGLIDALLIYSQSGNNDGSLEIVNLSDVVQGAMDNLKILIQESEVKIQIEELPHVLGDYFQLVQLFQNLISNAVKFRDKNRPAEIRIGCKDDGNTWKIFARDNGVGFDSAHSDRIFEIFQRFHSRDEYPGTGIGLAVAKKIVERHNGKIWVDSRPNEGATFYFTLMKSPN